MNNRKEYIHMIKTPWPRMMRPHKARPYYRDVWHRYGRRQTMNNLWDCWNSIPIAKLESVEWEEFQNGPN